MKKCALLAITALALVNCHSVTTNSQVKQLSHRQTESDRDKYQEEAYPIGQQEEAYQQKKTSR